MTKKNIFIYSFYSFSNIVNKSLLKEQLQIILSNKSVKGTILIADEGINVSISSSKELLDKIVNFLKLKLNLSEINIKVNKTNFHPFKKMKIRLKNEIVSLGKGSIEIKKFGGNYINPDEWDQFIKEKDTIVIDVRNDFEIKIGKFKGSINPKTKSFRDFPKQIDNLDLDINSKIVMYCTGGIRCEKASAFLRLNGYKNVAQLKGGIINYLDYMNKNRIGTENSWQGECFVFDDRVTIKKNLQQGKYYQCYACRSPITSNDTKLNSYKKGVSCKYCINSKSPSKIKALNMRQKQIDDAHMGRNMIDDK